MDLEQIRRIQSILESETPKESQPNRTEGEASFKETLQTFIKDVDNLQINAEEMSQKLVTGEVENIHQVMLAMEEAHTSFQLMMEMRNKILDAYREVMKMQV
jgi:flagellar hook-basal body complex protein FliE